MTGKQPDLQPSGVKLQLSHIHSKANPVSTSTTIYWASQVAQWWRIHLSMQETKRRGFDPWVGKIPWRRKWQPTPVFLPGKSHRQSLVGYSLWGHKESDTLSDLAHAYTHTHTYIPTHNVIWAGLDSGSFSSVPFYSVSSINSAETSLFRSVVAACSKWYLLSLIFLFWVEDRYYQILWKLFRKMRKKEISFPSNNATV